MLTSFCTSLGDFVPVDLLSLLRKSPSWLPIVRTGTARTLGGCGNGYGRIVAPLGTNFPVPMYGQARISRHPIINKGRINPG